MHKLKSEFHILENQGKRAICVVANNLSVKKSKVNGNDMKGMSLQHTALYQLFKAVTKQYMQNSPLFIFISKQ